MPWRDPGTRTAGSGRAGSRDGAGSEMIAFREVGRIRIRT
jgi:hypothetical protein